MELEIEGAKVRVEWYHHPHKMATDDLLPTGTGCKIMIYMPQEGWRPVFKGIAKLHPGDNFERNKGRKIALQRAIAPFPPEKRKLFWEAYFRMRNGKW